MSSVLLWLARDHAFDDEYVLSPSPLREPVREKRKARTQWSSHDLAHHHCDPEWFERLFPDLKLEPGHEPIRVAMSLERRSAPGV